MPYKCICECLMDCALSGLLSFEQAATPFASSAAVMMICSTCHTTWQNQQQSCSRAQPVHVLCSAITLGRVAWICPEGIAPHLGHFVGPWCAALRHIRDDVEKGHAFLGLCRLLRLNPQVSHTTCLLASAKLRCLLRYYPNAQMHFTAPQKFTL